MTEIELLAPAKNLHSGKTAINYGADAVYIGADHFSARAAAANSIADIAQLITYAHRYKSKVFVALNTILYDNELKEAEKLIHQVYNAGADALIIQDMGILQMDIPPIALHASTQANNFDLEHIKFMDKLGFERIVLARELSIDQITTVRQQTKCELEFFIHGALCVSLSGQCYFSQAITGRSANRGKCAQMCRHPYTLYDANGKSLVSHSHLLSLKDLNVGTNVKQLIDSGIQSLKIEGRLKDENYVKNIVSYYRKQIDHVLEESKHYKKASSGHTSISFNPDPEKSFNRRHSQYFLFSRPTELVNQSTPKSLGKELGKTVHVGSNFICIDSSKNINNGDGLCYIANNKLYGVRVEKVVKEKIFLNKLSHLQKGTVMFRNFDREFTKAVEADNAIRKIGVSIRIKEVEQTLQFELEDEDHLVTTHLLSKLPEQAKNTQRATENLLKHLQKSGDAMFVVNDVYSAFTTAYFFPISELNDIRRTLFLRHEQLRINTFIPKEHRIQANNVAYPKQDVNFSENISNKLAQQFYAKHKVQKMAPALEISKINKEQLLMTTRYCIKYELGYCQRYQHPTAPPKEPLYLEDNNRRYSLHFDCNKCMMQIRLAEK